MKNKKFRILSTSPTSTPFYQCKDLKEMIASKKTQRNNASNSLETHIPSLQSKKREEKIVAERKSIAQQFLDYARDYIRFNKQDLQKIFYELNAWLSKNQNKKNTSEYKEKLSRANFAYTALYFKKQLIDYVENYYAPGLSMISKLLVKKEELVAKEEAIIQKFRTQITSLNEEINSLNSQYNNSCNSSLNKVKKMKGKNEKAD